MPRTLENTSCFLGHGFRPMFTNRNIRSAMCHAPSKTLRVSSGTGFALCSQIEISGQPCAMHPRKHFVFPRARASPYVHKKKCPGKSKLFLGISFYERMAHCQRDYTNSMSTSIAASPLRGPIFTIRVYPPLRSAYFGAISSNNFCATSTVLVFFFLPAPAVGTSFTV